MARGRIRPSTMLMPVWVMTALVGVWFLGCTLSSQDGSALARAMPYRNLVEAFVHAIETAIAELNRANSTKSQPQPQYRCPSTNAGSCEELAKAVSLSVPQPEIWPHE